MAMDELNQAPLEAHEVSTLVERLTMIQLGGSDRPTVAAVAEATGRSIDDVVEALSSIRAEAEVAAVEPRLMVVETAVSRLHNQMEVIGGRATVQQIPPLWFRDGAGRAGKHIRFSHADSSRPERTQVALNGNERGPLEAIPDQPIRFEWSEESLKHTLKIGIFCVMVCVVVLATVFVMIGFRG